MMGMGGSGMLLFWVVFIAFIVWGVKVLSSS